MQKFVMKMIAERDELSARIKRARAAVEKPPFGADNTAITLLSEQICAMEKYRECLDKRIRHEGEE